MKIFHVETHGDLLTVKWRALMLRDRLRVERALPEKTRVIVASGKGFAVTAAALKICIERHIELLITDETHSFIGLFAPSANADASRGALSLRLKQFTAVLEPARAARIAKAIVKAKIETESHAASNKRTFLAALKSAKTTEEIRHLEAKAAQAFWQLWTQTELQFIGPETPAEWHTFPGRYIGRRQGRLGELAAQFTPRDAVHPMQALLNFAGAVLAARMARVVIAKGFDPAFGFLHGRLKDEVQHCGNAFGGGTLWAKNTSS